MDESMPSGTKSRAGCSKYPTTPGATTRFIPGAKYPWPRPSKKYPLRVYFYCETSIPVYGKNWSEEKKVDFYKKNEWRREQMRLRIKRDQGTLEEDYKYQKGDEMDWYDEYDYRYGEWTLSRRAPRPRIPFTDEQLEAW